MPQAESGDKAGYSQPPLLDRGNKGSFTIGQKLWLLDNLAKIVPGVVAIGPTDRESRATRPVTISRDKIIHVARIIQGEARNAAFVVLSYRVIEMRAGFTSAAPARRSCDALVQLGLLLREPCKSASGQGPNRLQLLWGPAAARVPGFRHFFDDAPGAPAHGAQGDAHHAGPPAHGAHPPPAHGAQPNTFRSSNDVHACMDGSTDSKEKGDQDGRRRYGSLLHFSQADLRDVASADATFDRLAAIPDLGLAGAHRGMFHELVQTLVEAKRRKIVRNPRAYLRKLVEDGPLEWRACIDTLKSRIEEARQLSQIVVR
jgi:hypothetical protein